MRQAHNLCVTVREPLRSTYTFKDLKRFKEIDSENVFFRFKISISSATVIFLDPLKVFPRLIMPHLQFFLKPFNRIFDYNDVKIQAVCASV